MHLRSFMLSAFALSALATPIAQAQSTEEKLDTLMTEVERLKQQVEKQKSAGESRASGGFGPRTSLGGYGELHYNNLDRKKELDFHRFVLFIGHRFSDRIRFNAELELEHALVKDTSGGTNSGEVELEQAFIDFDLTENHTARGGLFLVPVGILNETHEPPTFYGVERNPVETNIIPTTWWEAGGALYGRLSSAWGYDVAVTTGLKVPTTGASAYSIRSGRQKVSNAAANGGALTARLRWAGAPGIEAGVTAQYQSDVAQNAAGVPRTEAVLGEAHVALQKGPFGLRALYARWDIDGAGAAAVGRDEQYGWYIEPSYKITPAFGVFTRYNEWDTEAGDATASKKKQTDVGFNYWPHENVVIKVDVQSQSGAVSDDGFNVGLGYMF